MQKMVRLQRMMDECLDEVVDEEMLNYINLAYYRHVICHLLIKSNLSVGGFYFAENGRKSAVFGKFGICVF